MGNVNSTISIFIDTGESSIDTIQEYFLNQKVWCSKGHVINKFYFSVKKKSSYCQETSPDGFINFYSIPEKFLLGKKTNIEILAYVLETVDHDVKDSFNGKVFISFITNTGCSTTQIDCALPSGYLYINDRYDIDYTYNFDSLIIDRDLLPMFKGLGEYKSNVNISCQYKVNSLSFIFRKVPYKINSFFIVSSSMLFNFFSIIKFTVMVKIMRRINHYLKRPIRTNELYCTTGDNIDSSILTASHDGAIFRQYILENGLREYVRFLSHSDFDYSDKITNKRY